MSKPEPNPLNGRSLLELREVLLRQERLLGDRVVVSRLPDGGERVRECVARLRAAVAERERRRSGGGPEAAPPALALAGLSLAAEKGGRMRGRRAARRSPPEGEAAPGGCVGRPAAPSAPRARAAADPGRVGGHPAPSGGGPAGDAS